MASSSPTLPSSKKPPSRSTAMPGSGVVASRGQLRLDDPRLEAEFFGAAQHLRRRRPPRRQSDDEAARDRPRRPGNATASRGQPGQDRPNPWRPSLRRAHASLRDPPTSHVMLRVAAPEADGGLSAISAISVPPWPSLEATKVEFM